MLPEMCPAYLICNKASKIQGPVLDEAEALLKVGQAAHARITRPAHQQPFDLQAMNPHVRNFAARS